MMEPKHDDRITAGITQALSTVAAPVPSADFVQRTLARLPLNARVATRPAFRVRVPRYGYRCALVCAFLLLLGMLTMAALPRHSGTMTYMQVMAFVQFVAVGAVAMLTPHKRGLS